MVKKLGMGRDIYGLDSGSSADGCAGSRPRLYGSSMPTATPNA
jgi:hypothetical protein